MDLQKELKTLQEISTQYSRLLNELKEQKLPKKVFEREKYLLMEPWYRLGMIARLMQDRVNGERTHEAYVQHLRDVQALKEEPFLLPHERRAYEDTEQMIFEMLIQLT